MNLHTNYFSNFFSYDNQINLIDCYKIITIFDSKIVKLIYPILKYGGSLFLVVILLRILQSLILWANSLLSFRLFTPTHRNIYFYIFVSVFILTLSLFFFSYMLFCHFLSLYNTLFQYIPRCIHVPLKHYIV